MLHRHTGPFRALLGLLPLIALTADTAGAATGSSGGTGGSGQQTPPAGTSPPAGDKPADKPPATPPATPPVQAPAGTLTQEAVNALLAQERRQTEARFAPQVAAAAELEQIKAASATEQEKAVTKATQEAERATTVKFHGVLIDSNAYAQAATLGFHNPEVAVATLRARGLLDGIKVEDDGKVEADKIKSLLEGLVTSDPYLVKGAPAVPGASAVGLGGATSAGQSPETERPVQPGKDRIEYAYEQRAKNRTTT